MGFYSDWYDHHARLKTYTGDDLLIIKESTHPPVFGENYALCGTESAYQREFARIEDLREKILSVAKAGVKTDQQIHDEELQYVEKPLIPKEWVSDTADRTHEEVDSFSIKNSRPLMVMQISRKRRDFGGAWKFNDREAGDGLVECRQHKDPNYALRKRELDIGLQAVPSVTTGNSQTIWYRTINGAVQYNPNDFLDQQTKTDSIDDPELADFLGGVRIRIEEALQQNETVNIYQEEFDKLGEDDMTVGSKSESNIKELRTFISLEYSKNKIISAIDWLPKTHNIVAVACMENLTFDERVEVAGKATTSVILVWSFADLINPQYVLESPWDITCFRFNPYSPNMVVGGAVSGQVTIWDLSDAQEQIKTRNKTQLDTDEKSDSVAVVKGICLSTIDDSHKRPVSDLTWLPEKVEIDRKGNMLQTADGFSNQFVSTSGDGQILYWDIRFVKEHKRDPDIHWRPLFRFQLYRPDNGSELGGCHLCFPGHLVNSQFYCTTEDSELLLVDWSARSMDEEKKPENVLSLLDTDKTFRPTLSLQRSPFFSDILLTVHDWSFNIWKEGVDTPIFTSSYSSAYLTSGRWSTTRPGVLFMARSDCHLDIWDLTDQSHKPSLTQSVTSNAITSMEFLTGPSGGTQQLLAVGDNNGNLHILDIPKNLRRKLNNEENTMRLFFDREVKRVAYVKQRLVVREEERKKRSTDRNGDDDKADADIGKDTNSEDERAEQEYRQMEQKFREELGLIEK
eukprot:GILJ01002711.1.p1 GENE.GILJ01002711.1~~GILJ01002711.1.p1  ORF type:complete len:864 (-),score=136.71 GILJ01002711.1:252-2471(-)